MSIKKMSVIFAISTLLVGCCSGAYGKGGDNTTYGVENDKWSVMSYDQRESAKEVFRLDQIRISERNKLKTLHEQKTEAIAQRKIQHQEELSLIEHEDSEIRDQQSKLASITEKVQLRQKNREKELDSLKK